MKRILHITTHLNIGGISSYLLTLCQGLQALGNECHVASFGGELEEEFQKAGVVLHKIPLNTKNELSPKVFLSYFKLKKLQKKYNWNVVHAHTRVAQVLGYFLAKKLNIQGVTTFHGFYRHHWGRKVFPCLGNQTISNSYSVERDLKASYPKLQNNISTVLHGIHTDRFDATQIESRDQKAFKEKYGLLNFPTLGIMGRLSQEKGHLNLLEVLRILKDEYRLRLQLLIVGDGKYQHKIEKEVHRLGLEKLVRMVPSQKDPRIALSLMDIYVTHHEGPEGFGLSTLEAMAMEKPVVISYKKGGMEDFISHGQNGLLLSNASHHELAHAIKYLLTAPEIKKRLGKNAALKVKQEFSYLKMAQKTQTIYEKSFT
ncbi:MAG: hypothetical protein A3B70_05355 [Deltaproteobacteria bacterium RIFCSPHIGHO2_02_FULL_40_11]|nr:MAG: hypothetical protein A3B70_05355 [Deltaproteobacteria bacterium RIFCSPHIGHO2_02_FULL_40_11]